MMKKLVALLMALALLCSSIGAFATEVDETVEETAEESVVTAEVVEAEAEEETESEEEVALDDVLDDSTTVPGTHNHTPKADSKKLVSEHKYCTDGDVYSYECETCHATYTKTENIQEHEAGDGDRTTWKNGVMPTCTTGAIKLHTVCKNCKIGAWEEKVPAQNHTWSTKPEDNIEHKPTCTTDGTFDRYCTTCKTWIKNQPGEKSKGHSFEANKNQAPVEVNVPATCTEPGKKGTAIICNVCGVAKKGSEKTLETIPVIDHVEVFKKILKDQTYFTLTYKADGVTIATATLKDGVAIEDGVIKVPAVTTTIGTGENAKEYVVNGKSTITYVPATCTTAGSIAFKCEVCGKEYKVDLPAPGHKITSIYKDPNDGVVIQEKDLDCVKGYSVLYKCDNCDYYHNETVQQAAHSFTNRVLGYKQQKYGDKEPVEYAQGDIAKCIESWKVVQCDHCGVKKDIYVPADKNAKHEADPNSDLYLHTPATCTNYEETAYNCANCFFPQYKTGNKLAPHDWEKKVTKEATCSETGIRKLTCKNCGKVEEEVIPAIGHNYKVETIKTAHCDKGEVGTKGYKCQNCGDVKDTWTYEGHTNPNGVYQTNNPATCVKNGERTFYCTTCCQMVKEILPKTGHSFEYENEDINGKHYGVEKFEAAHEAACADGALCGGVKATCAEANPHGTIHTVTCKWCKKDPEVKKAVKLTWTQKNQPKHEPIIENGEVKSFMVDVAPTCCADGSASYVCKTCSGIVKGYKLPAFGHNKVPEYDAKKNIYVLKCKPLAVNGNTDTLTGMLVKAGYKQAIANKIVEKMLREANGTTNFRGIGCDWTEDIVVVDPKYVITVNGSDATIKLENDKMQAVAPVYLRVNWRYRLTNGDTVSFNYTFAPESVNGKETNFFIDAPDCDGKLEMTYIEVVKVRNAHRMDLGDYATYGSKKL